MPKPVSPDLGRVQKISGNSRLETGRIAWQRKSKRTPKKRLEFSCGFALDATTNYIKLHQTTVYGHVAKWHIHWWQAAVEAHPWLREGPPTSRHMMCLWLFLLLYVYSIAVSMIHMISYDFICIFKIQMGQSLKSFPNCQKHVWTLSFYMLIMLWQRWLCSGAVSMAFAKIWQATAIQHEAREPHREPLKRSARIESRTCLQNVGGAGKPLWWIWLTSQLVLEKPQKNTFNYTSSSRITHIHSRYCSYLPFSSIFRVAIAFLMSSISVSGTSEHPAGLFSTLPVPSVPRPWPHGLSDISSSPFAKIPYRAKFKCSYVFICVHNATERNWYMLHKVGWEIWIYFIWYLIVPFVGIENAIWT